MKDNTLPTLIQQVEHAFNDLNAGKAGKAELLGVSMTLFIKRGSIVSMETMSVTEEVDVKENEK